MSKRALASVLVLVALGCQEPPPSEGPMCVPDEERHEDSFDLAGYGVDLDDVCESSIDAIAAHATWVMEAWGGDPQPFEFGLYDSRDHECWPCDHFPTASGCAINGHTAATTIPHRHELSHAVRGQPCSPFVEEGWAMLYGDPFLGGSTAGDLKSVLAEIEGATIPAELYPFAARFVAWLLETRGVETLTALCEADGWRAESLPAALEEVLGQSVSEIASEFEAYPEWTLGALRQDLACEGVEDVAQSPASWTFAFDDCDAQGIEGHRASQLVATHLVELPGAGHHRFEFSAEEDRSYRLELRNCTREGMASIYRQTEVVQLYQGSTELLLPELPAGVYVLRLLDEEAGTAIPVEVRTEPWP